MSADMNTDSNDEQNNQPVVGLPGDERDVLITRVIDGVASSEDWKTFRAAAAHDPSIWNKLADSQRVFESLNACVHSAITIADQVELPGGVIDDGAMRFRVDLIARWGGWAAAAAIMLVWFFGQPSMNPITTPSDHDSVTAGLLGSRILLDQAKPDQAFDQYLSSGQSLGQVVGEMPERIVIETRPMPDGTIEVLYLRQIIERQIIDHVYRETHDEVGNAIPVPVKLSPTIERAF